VRASRELLLVGCNGPDGRPGIGTKLGNFDLRSRASVPCKEHSLTLLRLRGPFLPQSTTLDFMQADQIPESRGNPSAKCELRAALARSHAGELLIIHSAGCQNFARSWKSGVSMCG
jgi:hypothetical protein